MEHSASTRLTEECEQLIIYYGDTRCSYFSDNYAVEKKNYNLGNMLFLGLIAYTNMFWESFHGNLKVLYFNDMKNIHVDVLIHILLKIAKD